MAFFAVIQQQNKDFKVVQAHINLWCLGGLFGHNSFLCDVGLRLRVTGGQCVDTFQLAMPLDSWEEKCEDLHDCLRDQNKAELIFGGPVQIAQSNGRVYLKYDGASVMLGQLKEISRVKNLSGNGYSVWTVRLAYGISPNEDLYVRMRFPLARLGDMWLWKRSLWRKNGALLDFRVADVREAVSIQELRALAPSVVSIEKLNFLVVVPSFLQLRAWSPQLRYMRLLESRAWKEYLGQRPSLFSRSMRLVVYHWRYYEENNPLSVSNPFLGFMDFGRDDGFLRLENVVRIAGAVILLCAAAYYWADLDTLGQTVKSTWVEIRNVVAGITVSTLGLFLLKWVKPIGIMLRQAWKGFLLLERKILKVLRG